MAGRRGRWTAVEPPGLPTEPEKLEELGFAYCVRKLALSPRTEHELRAAMAERGYPGEAITRVLARLRRVGYVDDELFAAMWVDSRHRGRGLARRALTNELHRRGVDRELVTQAVERVGGPEERARAEVLVRAKLRSTPSAVRQDPPRLTRRLVSLLARKGYSSGLAYAVVSDVLRTEGEPAVPYAPDDASPEDDVR